MRAATTLGGGGLIKGERLRGKGGDVRSPGPSPRSDSDTGEAVNICSAVYTMFSGLSDGFDRDPRAVGWRSSGYSTDAIQ